MKDKIYNIWMSCMAVLIVSVTIFAITAMVFVIKMMFWSN